MIEYRYSETMEDVIEFLGMPYKEGATTEEKENTFFYALSDDEPNVFYNIVALATYEVKHNILIPRTRERFLDYAKRFDEGEFQPDMIPEDIPIVAKDIEFVRSMINA